MRDVITEMSSKALGMTCVVDDDGCLLGIITDGDLRRQIINKPNILDQRAGEVMTKRPIVIEPSTLAASALLMMEQRKITSLVVASVDLKVQGVLHLHNLWRTGLF
jgi:arabinose-5-phosphate isomerase